MAEQLTQEEADRIRNALAEGRKIEAIKFYREASGKGLKEAKEHIEELIPKLQEEDPDRYAKLSKGSGCAAAIVLCLGVASATLAWLLRSTG